MAELETAQATSPNWLLGAATSGNGKLAKVIQATALVGSAYRAGRGLHNRITANRIFTVSIESKDGIYEDLNTWLIDKMRSSERRSLAAATSRRNNEPASVGSGRPVPRVMYRYDGKRQIKFKLDGHPISAVVSSDGKDYHDGFMTKDDRIILTAKTEQGRDAVMKMLSDIARKSAPGPQVYIAASWGDWNRSEALTARNLDTVVLAEGQAERLRDDLGRFLDTEEAYKAIGVPWHRGYLLYGPPGTGKTSLARALATEFELDVYYLPLSDLKSDTNLSRLISNIAPRSVMLLEDIDVVHASKSRDDEEGEHISMSGLLNALDGVMTPHGLITIMTTNDPSVLDQALIRPGRADIREEIGNLDEDQLSRLIMKLTGEFVPVDLRGRSLTPANVVEVVKSNLGDHESTMRELRAEFG